MVCSKSLGRNYAALTHLQRSAFRHRPSFRPECRRRYFSFCVVGHAGKVTALLPSKSFKIVVGRSWYVAAGRGKISPSLWPTLFSPMWAWIIISEDPGNILLRTPFIIFSSVHKTSWIKDRYYKLEEYRLLLIFLPGGLCDTSSPANVAVVFISTSQAVFILLDTISLILWRIFSAVTSFRPARTGGIFCSSADA